MHLALFFKDERFTWNEIDARVSNVERQLQEFQLEPGDRVTIQQPNDVSHLFLWFALMRLGAVMVPLNPRLTSPETQSLFELAQPKLHWGEKIESLAAPSHRPGASVGLFTSGTTGTPKLVQLSRDNFAANAAASATRLKDDAGDVWLGTLPLFHVGGLAMAFRWATQGGTLRLAAGFEVAQASAAFDLGITQASLVPTTLNRLLEFRQGAPFVGLKAVLIGGAPMSSELLARAKAAGLPVLQTWGLTECCSQVTTESPELADGQSAGIPIDGVQIKVCDERGEPVPQGSVGELYVKGPTLALGLPEWFGTKDLGSMDAQGRVTIVSRRVDLIISGGENIYPAEVEAVLLKHPSVVDVAVVAIADSIWGEVPVACVVLSASVTSWTSFLESRLARFKHPKVFVIKESIPRNAMGKINRKALRDEIQDLKTKSEI
jgi:o-succinylbenzoate---CoA ligase